MQIVGLGPEDDDFDIVAADFAFAFDVGKIPLQTGCCSVVFEVQIAVANGIVRTGCVSGVQFAIVAESVVGCTRELAVSAAVVVVFAVAAAVAAVVAVVMTVDDSLVHH